MTLLRKFNNDILVSVWVGPDGKNSDDFIVQFDQSDLLLPSIDYYKLGDNHPIIKVLVNERTSKLGKEEKPLLNLRRTA